MFTFNIKLLLMAISCFIVLPLIIVSISLVNTLKPKTPNGSVKNTFWTNWRASLLAWSGIFTILFLIQLVLPTSNTTYYEYIILLFPIWIHIIILFDAAKREPYKNNLKVAVILLFILLHLLVLAASYFQPRSIVQTFSDDYRSKFADSDYKALSGAESQKQSAERSRVPTAESAGTQPMSEERSRVPKAESAGTQPMSENKTIEGQKSHQYEGLRPVEQTFYKQFVSQVDNVLDGEGGDKFVQDNRDKIAKLITEDVEVKKGFENFYNKTREEMPQTSTLEQSQKYEILKKYLIQAPLEFKYRLYTQFFTGKPNS